MYWVDGIGHGDLERRSVVKQFEVLYLLPWMSDLTLPTLYNLLVF
jgi:hypothetical protein